MISSTVLIPSEWKISHTNLALLWTWLPIEFPLTNLNIAILISPFYKWKTHGSCILCKKHFENRQRLREGKRVDQVWVSFQCFVQDQLSLPGNFQIKGTLSPSSNCNSSLSRLNVTSVISTWIREITSLGCIPFLIHLCLCRWWEWQLEVGEWSLHNESDS